MLKIYHYVRSLESAITRISSIPPLSHESAGVVEGIHPVKHQLHAAAVIQQAGETKEKAVLIADESGMGKTMTACIGALANHNPDNSIVLIVVPSNATNQWKSEIQKSYGDRFNIHMLKQSDCLDPDDVFQHDIVIVTYDLVQDELDRTHAYHRELSQWAKAKGNSPPPGQPL
ncbi:hypothetical protein CC79DRAFT_524758 [Sarocladium strictum]